MKNTDKATPRPWYISGDYIQSAVRETDGYICETDGLTKAEAKANAELIVKAVNSHEFLVEACKIAKRAVKNLAKSEDTELFKILEKALKQAEEL